MAEDKPGGAVASYTIKNNGRGGRFVNNPDGAQVSIAAGGQVTVNLTEAEATSAKRRPEFEVTKASTKERKAADKPDGGGTVDTQNPGPNQDAPDKAVSYVRHKGLGRYHGYNAAGDEVEGAGPWDKEAAKTWATENKVEFREGAGAAS